jgi:hypothetical protein
MTKAYMMEIAFQLWGAKLIDIEGVYKLLPEFPGKQEALDRIKAQMQPQSVDPTQVEAFIKSLPEEVLQVMDAMPEEQRLQMIDEMMKLDPEALQQFIGELMGGGQSDMSIMQ